MRRLLLLALVLAGTIAATPPDSGASTAAETTAAETQPGPAAQSGSSTAAGAETQSGQAAPTGQPSTTPETETTEAESTPSTAPTTPLPTITLPAAPPPAAVSEVRQQPGAAPKRRSPRAHTKRQPAAGQTGGSAAGTPSQSQPAGAPTLAPGPNVFGPFIPSPVAMPQGASPVLSFFIDTYRMPPFLLPIYLAAGERYAVPWQVLAAINEVESDYGYDLSVSSAGAEGWMQFLPEEWSAYGVDANGVGVRDPYNPADAIFAAARYLHAAGAAHDLKGAVYAYNHSWSYVESVLLRARLLEAAPRSLIDGLAAIVDGRTPLQSAGALVATPVWAKVPIPGARALRPVVVGANIATTPGTPVLAVQTAKVVRIVRHAKLGSFIELRDTYGDLYTYAHLGALARRLRRGTWVAPGTALGYVAGGSPEVAGSSPGVAGRSRGARAHFLFEIEPAGAGPIDPRPVLDAWRLLGLAQGQPQPGTQPLFGPIARDRLAGGIVATSRRSANRRSTGRRRPKGHQATASLSASAAWPGPVLGAAQWSRLIAHIARLPQPHVPRRPTSAALADTPSSPAPVATWPAASPSLLAPASPQSEPAVAVETEPAGPELVGESLVTLKLKTTLAPGSIESVAFEIRLDEAASWQEVESGKPPAQSFALLRPAEELSQDGAYELRVLVTENATHAQYVSPTIERLIVIGESPVVKLVAPESPLRGTVKLQAEAPPGVEVGPIRFEWAPSGTSAWKPIPVPPSGSEPTGCAPTTATACFDTASSEAPNGHDDFRAVPAGGEGSAFVSLPVRGRLVDNAPPQVTAVEQEQSESPSSGDITLKATATDPPLPDGEPASGMASVAFEETRAGARAWKQVPGGLVTVPQSAGAYVHRLHTELLENGRYKLRARAVDAAGNESVSHETEIEVHNAEAPPVAPAAITGVVAPAEDVTILGAVAAGSSPQHETETWAYGFTHAPPARVEGSRLDYTAEGHQLVLLRYLQRSGWQIADVLREEGGVTPFELVPADELDIGAAGGVQATGAITPSGVGWLRLIETPLAGARTIALFHRKPGGRFEYDRGASETLKPLLEANSAQLHLGQDQAGHAFGLLTAGTPEYALLKEGAWTRETALQRPAGIAGSEAMTLRAGDVQGPGEAWGAFTVAAKGHGLILGRLYAGEWHFPPRGVGLDALDLTGALATGGNDVEPEALAAEPESSAVWIGAKVLVGRGGGQVVARYDGKTGEVTSSWCTLPVANSCEEPLGSAAVPDAFFQTVSGPVAVASHGEAVDLYARGRWTSVPAPGHDASRGDAFTGPAAGWLGGTNAVGQLTAEEGSSLLTPWPLPDRSPLTSIALQPGSQAGVGESGALAVGLDGAALRYEASTGWQVVPLPPRAHHLAISSVAFAGPSSAFAVGQFGLILHWDGTSWSEDPQSISLTQSQLDAVAFATDGEGWAVGANGTILHYDGRRWSTEATPAADSAENISSVAVAGSEAFAIAGGNLIRRPPGGAWEEVGEALLPSAPKLVPHRLSLVAGLPDGGVVAAGRSTVLVREAAGQAFEYAEQPLSGVAVALAPFREAGGKLRAYVSVAPPVNALTGEVGGFPPGDGELLRETADGWQDLSRSQYAGGEISGDGAVKSDPVLALATDPAGEHAWAAGGYDGTEDAAHQGTTEVLSARPAGWRTASIWRYDTTGDSQPPVQAAAAPSIPAKPGVVSFAFFTSPMCKLQCSAVPGAQPQVNLNAAAKQIASAAAQPGGPSFAMLGGNAAGPMEQGADAQPAADFARLPGLLAPLGGLPAFAALGHFDQPNEAAWAEAFAEAPQPFGSGVAAGGIAPVSSGSPTPNGDVHRYYAFDAAQNGASLRVIALDDSEGQLEGAATTGQRHWLEEQLAQAQTQGLATVVIAATPLQDLKEGESLAALLAKSGVLGVFTTSDRRLDERRMIPENPAPEAPQVPEYEGASLGYQKPQNNGVKWYLVSVDAQAREVHVAAVPVIASLTLKPVDGLNVARSLTLQFEAIGRRPPGTLATVAGRSEEPSEPGEPFPGYDNYVEIPAPSCGARPCVKPSYAFTSSEPTIGDFVEPSGPGSPLPKLSASGHPIPSSSSSLFCAYNAGTTVVSIATGLLSYSLPVTVRPGGFGSPCGTVHRAGVGETIRVRTSRTQGRLGGAVAPPPPSPAPASAFPAALAAIPPAPAPPALTPPPAPAPAPAPTPAPMEPPLPVPVESVVAPPSILPPAAPPIEPVPPGAGGFAQSPAAAERKEKAHKHASQSAFSIRPAGTNGAEWFYGALALTTMLALLLSARALRSRPRVRPALLTAAPSKGPAHSPPHRR